jgi:hypothetical protein
MYLHSNRLKRPKKMQTVSWRDVAHAKTPGPVSFGDYSLDLRTEDIARWVEDPDGRFKLVVSETLPQAKLGMFYPSL